MGNILPPLFALILITIQLGEPRDPQEIDVGRTLATAALYLAICWLTTALAVRGHTQRRDGQIFRLPPALGFLHFGLFAGVVFGTDWVPLAQRAVADLPFLNIVAALAPFVLMNVGRLLIIYPTERAVRHRGWSCRGYVVFHLRIMAIPVLPLVVLGGLRDLVLGHGALARYADSYLPLFSVLSIGLMLVVFALAPLLVRGILFARPLAAGPLRTRLVDYGERTGFRPSEILVWNTEGAVTNALYIGILPFLRYVVLTDALLRSLDDPAVEAVYAHEAGHGVRQHTLFYLLLVIGLVLTTTGFQEDVAGAMAAVASAVGLSGPALETVVVTAMAVFFALTLLGFLFVVFGWLSRRFETEADLYAVRTLSEPDDFPRALEAIGLHSGVLGRRGGMQHFGIGRRLGLINRYRSEPDFRESFDRLLRWCRRLVLAFVILGALRVGLETPRYLEEGGLRYAAALYYEARDADDAGGLREAAERAARRGDHPEFGSEACALALAALSALADLHLDGGDYGAASRVRDEMADLDPIPESLGDFNLRLSTLILRSLEGQASREEVRELAVELGRLDSPPGRLIPESVQETYGDLYLMERAGGGKGPPPGTRDRYPPIARLLLWWEERGGAEGETPLPPGLRARDWVSGETYRRDLFHAATERFPEELLAELPTP